MSYKKQKFKYKNYLLLQNYRFFMFFLFACLLSLVVFFFKFFSLGFTPQTTKILIIKTAKIIVTSIIGALFCPPITIAPLLSTLKAISHISNV